VNLSKVAWLVSLPLSAAGMLLAHESAWELVEHDHAAGEGHGYLQYAAVLGALILAALVVGATAQLIRGVSGAGIARPPSAWVFATVPIIGFLLQEHLEHLVASRELDIGFFVSAPFLLGLVLQLPFAFAALFVARLILGLVATVVRVVNALGIVPGLTSLRFLVPVVPALAPRPALASRSAGRAPPRLS
jgi:hypothetical protein